MVNRRHDFRRCTQEQGEKFKEWWEKKLAKALECDLEAMKSNNWLVLVLLLGVSDTMFQKQFLLKTQANLLTLFNDPTRDSIANNFVISFYCRCLQILYQIAFFYKI